MQRRSYQAISQLKAAGMQYAIPFVCIFCWIFVGINFGQLEYSTAFFVALGLSILLLLLLTIQKGKVKPPESLIPAHIARPAGRAKQILLPSLRQCHSLRVLPKW